jgi:hypothetical protein
MRLLSKYMDTRRMLDGSDPFYAGTRPQYFNGMTGLGPGGHSPKLGEGPFELMLPVTEWREQTVYILGPTFVRRTDIVLAVANKDGGRMSMRR